jgi:uroporphyrinogen-III decarboxylase
MLYLKKNCLELDDRQLARLDDMYDRYRLLHQNPDGCRPMIIVNTPVKGQPSWEERLADPLVMLHAELNALRPHLEIEDDRVPTVRIQFGTAQVAAAFGCSIVVPENNLPAAGSHVLARAEDVRTLPMPSLDAGWYGKLAEWTALWKEHLPEGVHIQHPDIQSAFNSAHLIRGNDILTDFFDDPESLGLLLDKVTDFMINITRHTKAMISNDADWFFDWGSLWKGFARISNCTMQMISPELYREHVLPRDVRFFEAVGGGRMHYCGITGAVIDEYLKVAPITGLDFDATRHDFFAICDKAPDHIVLTPTGSLSADHQFIARLLKGDWPKKRNIIIAVNAASAAEGRQLIEALKKSIHY